jgi:hypothetical protein
MTKNNYLAVMITATVLLTGCTAKVAEPEKPLELDTFDKRLSYLFAYDSASLVKEAGIKFDVEVIQQAIEDVNNGKEARLSIQEAQDISRHFKLLQMESSQN